MWRLGNWENGYSAKREYDGHLSEAEIFEAGADAMHKADVDFIRIFYPEAYFRIQSSMTKEQFEAWAK